MAPIISVIIPSWNTASYLQATLQSVAAQTFREFEVIMVDDASTDETYSIMQGWVGRDTRFHTIRFPENRGVVAARNAAMNLAKGEYVAMLDGDDLWVSDALSCRYKAAMRFPKAAVIATDFSWFENLVPPDPVGRVNLGLQAREVFAEAYRNEQPVYFENPFNVVATLHFAWTGATLVRRDKMTEVGNFDPNFFGPEDTLLWLKLANRAPFVFIPVVTAHYRQRAGSLVHLQREPKEFHYLKVLQYIVRNSDFAARRISLNRIMSMCYDDCATNFRKQEKWRLARKHAIHGVNIDPFTWKHWRNIFAALLKR